MEQNSHKAIWVSRSRNLTGQERVWVDIFKVLKAKKKKKKEKASQKYYTQQSCPPGMKEKDFHRQ